MTAVASKDARALELRRHGLLYHQIAAELGWSHREQARRAVARARGVKLLSHSTAETETAARARATTRARVLELCCDGLPWSQIAAEVGWKHQRDAQTTVRRVLAAGAEAVTQRVEERIRGLEKTTAVPPRTQAALRAHSADRTELRRLRRRLASLNREVRR
jgi:hypothetical protein